jgi:hypothetical protein
MTLQEWRERLSAFKSELESSHAKIMLQIGNQAMTMIRQRVTETGVGADGNKLKPYSTRPTLASPNSFLKKRGFNEFRTRFKESTGVKKKRKGSKANNQLRGLMWYTVKRGGKTRHLFLVPGGYKQIREYSGLKTDKTDLTFTGAMWRNTGIIRHSKMMALIGPKAPDERKKMDNLGKRYGTIMALTEEERAKLQADYDALLLQMFTKHGLR